tara:strand:+ start:460 stop:870 length:411 start_codon:yes stop_codon:yes gene_type:complete
MKTIIITINILLLSLILYNLLSRGDKLIENLDNCDAENSKQNALTAKINNQFNVLDRIKKKKNEANGILGAAVFKILFSGQVQGKSQTKLTKKKDKEMGKINDAAGERDSVKSGSAKYIEPDGKLGQALSQGPEQS